MTVMAYTSFTYAYLTRAAVLAESLRRAHPDWMLWALVVDLPPPGFDDAQLRDGPLLGAFDRVVHAHTLGIDRFRSWMFKHDVVEACTAVKGQMLCELLDAGAEQVFYFDPDMAVFNPMPDLPRRLETSSVLLTPHQLAPNDALPAATDNEMTSLRYGIYNLGFLGVRNDACGRRFAHWWNAQLLRECYDEPERGIFTDQKYCDGVPALFERVHVLRDPGCNVASWNISRRQLAFTADGDIEVNGSPLKFYHFTKIFGIGETMTDHYSADNQAVLEIMIWYRRRIQELDAGLRAVTMPPDQHGETASLPWYYGTFQDGRPIAAALRRLYRSRPDVMAYFDNPFDAEGNSFLAWAQRERPDLLATP